MVHKKSRRFDIREYKRIAFVQILYGCFFVLWATWITYLDVEYHDSFSVLVFVTIITIVPVFTFINPWIWGSIEIISIIGIIMMAAKYDMNFIDFLVNFGVFGMISFIAGISSFRIRKNNYLNQISLEKLYIKNRDYAYMDSLTGLPNRRSFFDEIEYYEHGGIPEKLVLACFDLNRLKYINDSQGHEAGDEFLETTAECLKKVFAQYGKICRVGGDEFYGIFTMSSRELQEAVAKLKVCMAEWKGYYSDDISISMGFAQHEKYPDFSIEDLKIMADKEMYKDKIKFYDNTGYERRGK